MRFLCAEDAQRLQELEVHLLGSSSTGYNPPSSQPHGVYCKPGPFESGLLMRHMSAKSMVAGLVRPPHVMPEAKAFLC